MRFVSLLLLILLGRAATAATPWEVAVIFLGSGEDAEFQEDIDKNVLELARLTPGPDLRLGIYRELTDRAVQVYPDPSSTNLHRWDSLFFKAPISIEISGEMKVWPREREEASILASGERLKSFLNGVFGSSSARRLLVLHGHGLAFDGMKAAALSELRENLSGAISRPLDILWLDSCFMASVEALHELRGTARRIMASEDSEFSAGAPFDTLKDLLEPGPDNAEEVAEALAERFLESYSFIKHGSQTPAVYRSSATISVVDPEKIEGLLPGITSLAGELKRADRSWKEKLGRYSEKIRMERKELVDLGTLLLKLKYLKVTNPSALISLLEVGKPGKLKTNPRIKAEAPEENSQLVWGYEEWERGHEGDDDVLDKLPRNLTPAGFETGPGEKSWPYRNVVKRLYLAPFTVGLNRFDFFFVTPRGRRTPPRHYIRYTDMVSFEADVALNPVRYTGYTQGVGMTAERYSGLSIATPLIGIPNLNYMDTRFYRETRWTDF